MSVAQTITAPEMRLRVPAFRGAARELMDASMHEVCMDGPAGTGKSYAALWKMHLRRLMFPNSRGLLARKTLISLKSSTLVTYREQVLGPLYTSGVVKFWTAKGDEPAHYAYPNGSKLVIVGLDKPGKAMSTEYDDILVDEALDTEEQDIEALLSRIQRPGHLYGVEGRPPYAQLILVTNPGPPMHWLNRRMEVGRTARLLSRHMDNPAMTPEYLSLLDHSLTGVRRERLLFGRWASAEGMIYQDSFERKRNLIERSAVTRFASLLGDCGIPRAWPRYMGVDFGYTNPFVAKWYAQDPDGRLYMYREIYMTNRLVEDHARAILHYAKWHIDGGRLMPTARDSDPLPRAIFADHDAEGRATLERHIGWYTTAAVKDVQDGIQTVAARWRPAGDGMPRLFYLQGSLVERDPRLDERKLPTCSLEEVEGYVWDVRGGRAKGEEPLKENDHGQDTDRYVCHTLDRRPTQVSQTAFRVF